MQVAGLEGHDKVVRLFKDHTDVPNELELDRMDEVSRVSDITWEHSSTAHGRSDRTMGANERTAAPPQRGDEELDDEDVTMNDVENR